MMPCRLVAFVCVYLASLLPPSMHTSLPQEKTNAIHERYFDKRQQSGNVFIYSHAKGCGQSPDNLPMYRCPTLDHLGGMRCIDGNSLCNHVPDCPEGEDEQASLCLFYRVIDRDLRALFDFIMERFETHIHRRH